MACDYLWACVRSVGALISRERLNERVGSPKLKKMQKGIFINFDSEKVPSVTVLVASGSRTVKNGMKGHLIYGENLKMTELIYLTLCWSFWGHKGRFLTRPFG